jgi:hypothetical protein
MQKTSFLTGQGCGENCDRCDCPHCGGEVMSKLIHGRHKKDYRRFQRRQDKSLLRQVHAIYNWRTL